MTQDIVDNKYDQFIEDVGAIYQQARKVMAEAYWQIGKRIVEVEQDGEIKAQYGTKLIQSIADDLSEKYGMGFSKQNLFRMRSFYLKFPKVSAPRLLNWTQYTELLSVRDDHKRCEFEERAVNEKLSSRQIRAMVREEAQVEEPPSYELLKRPQKLMLNTYTLADDLEHDVPEGHVCVDCGFHFDVCVPADPSINIVEKSAFTYSAKIKRVVDGDTLLVEINLGFNAHTHARLRLRGIDTPEMDTPEGKKAKRFVEKLLPAGKSIVLRSYSTDIFGRFVADVFYCQDDANPQDIIARGRFLNNELLKARLATRIS